MCFMFYQYLYMIITTGSEVESIKYILFKKINAYTVDTDAYIFYLWIFLVKITDWPSKVYIRSKLLVGNMQPLKPPYKLLIKQFIRKVAVQLKDSIEALHSR